MINQSSIKQSINKKKKKHYILLAIGINAKNFKKQLKISDIGIWANKKYCQ